MATKASRGIDMDRENIISTWFAISTAHANINTSLYTCVCDEQKKYCATISVGMLYDFSNADTDIYKAIERTISQYSQWVIENESKESCVKTNTRCTTGIKQEKYTITRV